MLRSGSACKSQSAIGVASLSYSSRFRPGSTRANNGKHTHMKTASHIRILITAGPTREPIDAVRYLSNRSSGRLGVAIARTAMIRGFSVRTLLGPCCALPDPAIGDLMRFETAADLKRLLNEHVSWCDVLIMAAAVADYRPTMTPDARAGVKQGKLRRSGPITLTLEPTPDLLATAAATKRADQVFVGFALESSEGLEAAARAKLASKGIDMIVANPLETMDSPTIRASLFAMDRKSPADGQTTPGAITKAAFADWLLDRVVLTWRGRQHGQVRQLRRSKSRKRKGLRD